MCAHLSSVNRILKCRTHYEVLGVTSASSASEIKKAYFKVARELHPDKNDAKVPFGSRSSRDFYGV